MFVEKSEMIDALVNARKEGMALVVDGEGPLCYICLDGGNETEGPLRRDCACRGDDAGYAPLLPCSVCEVRKHGSVRRRGKSTRTEGCRRGSNKRRTEESADGG